MMQTSVLPSVRSSNFNSASTLNGTAAAQHAALAVSPAAGVGAVHAGLVPGVSVPAPGNPQGAPVAPAAGFLNASQSFNAVLIAVLRLVSSVA